MGSLKHLRRKRRGGETQITFNNLNKFWELHCHHVDYSAFLAKFSDGCESTWHSQLLLLGRKEEVEDRKQDHLEGHPSHTHGAPSSAC